MTNLKNYCKYLQTWSQQILNGANASGVVVGLSGGIDSAVVANLLKTTTNVLGVWINIESQDFDFNCYQQLKQQGGFKTIELNLTRVYRKLVKILKTNNKLSLINLKVRLRMNCLYSLAQQNNYLVVGTSNKDELYLGYFTKYGDGASDFLPLANLNKSQIKQMASLLNVPETIINRAPSAGLYPNQTDEQDMGVSYNDIDAFLNNKKINSQAKNIIEHLHKVNLHKLSLPLKPEK